jgi:hypothetical protein
MQGALIIRRRRSILQAPKLNPEFPCLSKPSR